MKKFFLMAAIFMVVIALILGGCAKQAPSGAKTLRIGHIDVLTGPASDVLKLFAWGSEYGAKYVNSQGGITVNGEKYMIEVMLLDGPIGSPETYVSHATKMVFDEKIKLITGGAPPHLGRAMISVTEPNEALYFLAHYSGGWQDIVRDLKYQFYTSPGQIDLYKNTMGYLKELHPEVKSLVCFIPAEFPKEAVLADLRRIGAGFGLTVLDLFQFAPDTVDFTPITQKLVGTGADAMMGCAGSTPSSGGILKAAREMGYNKPICGANVNPVNEILDIAGPQAGTNYFTHSLPADTPDMTPELKAIAELAIAKAGFLDIAQSVFANGIYTLAQIIEEAQSFDPATLVSTLEKMDTVETIFGTGKVGGSENYGHKRMVYHPFPIWRIEGGKAVFGKWGGIDVLYSP